VGPKIGVQVFRRTDELVPMVTAPRVLLCLLFACSCEGNGLRSLTAPDGGDTGGGGASSPVGPLDMAVLVDVVDKEGIYRPSRVSLTQGLATYVSCTLASAAADVTMEVDDANGDEVRTESFGPMAVGRSTLVWDGANDSGVQEPSGTYGITVSATDINGQAVWATQAVCQEGGVPPGASTCPQR
jgi:hypothetical protein